MTNPEDCKPYESSDGKSHLEKIQGLRHEMDEAFEKLYDKGYHATVVNKQTYFFSAFALEFSVGAVFGNFSVQHQFGKQTDGSVRFRV